ncbi:MAG: FKBP-type peptidyl-prolyl cis-trans isomerase [Planctomycetaceae bacterium]
MRRWLVMLSLVAVVAVGFAIAQDEKPKAKAQPKAKKPDDGSDLGLEPDPNAIGKKPANKKELLDKISYGIGQQMGQQLTKMKQAGFDLDQKRLLQGMEEALQGKESEFTDDEINNAFKAFEPLRRAAASKASTDFLAANKEKEGVKTLPSGLQYKVLTAGKGATPKANDTVKVHYRGKLIDGKVFDQSYVGEAPTKKDEAFEFKVKSGPGGVIEGWVQAVLKMKVGDKWQITLPADLAYGPNGSPPVIGPNAVLVFDVELLEIVD